MWGFSEVTWSRSRHLADDGEKREGLGERIGSNQGRHNLDGVMAYFGCTVSRQICYTYKEGKHAVSLLRECPIISLGQLRRGVAGTAQLLLEG